jgi:subtilisin-like proprotein convertase family protein
MRLGSLVLLAFNVFVVLGQNALPILRPPYAPLPADNYFTNQFYLDQRDEGGQRVGPDLNARGAWMRSKGEGVVVGLCDDGVEMTHHDLVANMRPDLSFDFELGVTNGEPRNSGSVFGTPAAGLIAAALNGEGIVGLAPGAQLASWIIYPTNALAGRTAVAPEKLATMFTYQSNIVQVQVHNWVENPNRLTLFAQTPVESDAISNAVTFGRSGKGVVMVKPVGNANYNGEFDSWIGRNANDNAFISDPRVIAVGAARIDGRIATYSERGACVLVSGVSGDFFDGFPAIFTTDRTGTDGFNQVTFPTEPMLSDYVFGSFAARVSETRATAPMVGGVCALILSVNPTLSYRDVQQILIHASRHFDKADPDLRQNGAGYWVSHRLGYGIPDAGEAVRLAQVWTNRPAMVRQVYASDIATNVPIPDAGLVVSARALGAAPPISTNFIAFPSLGPQPDDPTADLPLVDIGLATNVPAVDLRGKAALIQRGVSFFNEKINNAAAAGAEFAVVYNNATDPPLTQMGLTDFVPIPAIFIRKVDGEQLQNYITNEPSLRVQLRGTPAQARFNVTDQMVCEHVGVRVQTTHTSRQDLRITLVSPMGTRSVLQEFNQDFNPGPTNWVYWSTQHFYELSSGSWTLEVLDEVEGETGDLVGAELIVQGTPIQDNDDDGLDDRWEMANFGNLNQGTLDDPDHDGSWNAREQALGTNPNANQTPFALSASITQPGVTRFSFPSIEGVVYTIRSTTDLNEPFADIGTTVGEFGETEIISDLGDPRRFFLLRAP